MISNTRAEPASIELDWMAYYDDFDRVHGGNPVEYEGRLLYQDGWMFSSHDFRGPEYPPPKDAKQVRRLQRAYWLLALRRTRLNLKAIERQYNLLKEWQERLTGKLHEQRSYYSDEGRYIVASIPIPFDLYEIEIEQLKTDAQHCRQRLLALNDHGNQRQAAQQRVY